MVLVPSNPYVGPDHRKCLDTALSLHVCSGKAEMSQLAFRGEIAISYLRSSNCTSACLLTSPVLRPQSIRYGGVGLLISTMAHGEEAPLSNGVLLFESKQVVHQMSGVGMSVTTLSCRIALHKPTNQCRESAHTGWDRYRPAALPANYSVL